MTDAEMAGSGAQESQAQRPLTGAETPAEGPEARIAELEGLLAVATAELGKSRDEWLRARAEMDNIRRRGQDDLAKAHRFSVEGFAAALLGVKDSLDAALAVENTSIESFKEGVELTARQLENAFEKFAIKALAPMGERFDPHRHQAISQVDSDQEPGTVVTVLQKGYLIHDRVLRPALVIVARAASSQPAPGDGANP